jgi:methionine-rich copper-binding protein CopC
VQQRNIFLTVLLGSLSLGVTTASAHTVLISSNPAKNSVIKALPVNIVLTFADPLLTLGKSAVNRIVVTDSTNTVISTNKYLVKGGVLTDPLNTAGTKAGRYLVKYRVSAEDGHVVTGSFSFKVKP